MNAVDLLLISMMPKGVEHYQVKYETFGEVHTASQRFATEREAAAEVRRLLTFGWVSRCWFVKE
jgi:hypothetical protein